MGRRVAVIALAAMLGSPAQAETDSAPVVTARTRATLMTAVDSVVPGTSVLVALHLQLKSGWHTYWRNPGDAGEPASVTFHVAGQEIKGPQAWPTPERIDIAGIVSYGHHGDVVLLTTIPVPAAQKGQSQVQVDAEATWLVCEKVCVPEKGRFTLTLPVSSGSALVTRSTAGSPPLPEAAGLFARTAQGWTLQVPAASSGSADGPVVDAYFFPERGDLIDHSAPQVMQARDNGITLALTASQLPAEPPTELRGVLAVTHRRAGGTPRTSYLDVAARPAADAR